MQSEKPTYKKVYEPIGNYEESTWMGNDTPFMETDYTGVFKDRYPCAGQTIMWPHIHFIPRHKGDSKEIGGMRHAHPEADHRKYY
mgnify:CR=1 FL=1